MAVQTYLGDVSTVTIFDTTVEKTFYHHPRHYTAEVEALRHCTPFGFTPEVQLEDPVQRIVTLQRVGVCDALECMLKYGKHPSAKTTLLQVALLLRKQLKVLHDNGIYHGDVKLENLTLEYSDQDPFVITKLYLIDFATSSFLNKKDPTHRTVPVYSEFYSSFEAKEGLFRSSKRDDVWSFLTCLYVWVSGGFPLYGRGGRGGRDGRDDFWYDSFRQWYINNDVWFWKDVVAYEMLTQDRSDLLKSWFTAVKLQPIEDGVFELPTDHELETLFDA